jgi:trk system potassium uptake protein TrkH
MTMGAFVAMMLKRRLSMRFEAAMSDIVEANGGENAGTLIRFICIFTLVAEVLGAVSLYFGWRHSPHFHSQLECVYHSVFHSISAFCNAGFSLNDNSLIYYVDSIPINITVCLLIVVGGIGFAVVRDIKQYVSRWLPGRRRGRLPRLTTHTKLVLSMTAILLLIGFVVIFIMESNASLHDQPLKTRILAAMFQSVTPRTAGFNTIEMGPLAEDSPPVALAPSTIFLLMALMYIGGSPGGTAGGIKTTTIGIMVASIIATLRGRSKAELFHHSVAEEIVHRVASILLLSAAVLAAGIFLLLITETAPFRMIMFEAMSAFGTVGLSTGLSGPGTTMTGWGKVILTVLMFIGRLGPITLVLSVAQLRERAVYRYPEDQILVG